MDDSKSSRSVSFMSQCGFPQFLFMRLLWVYFLLSDITIFYAYGHGVPVLKRWTEFIGLFPIPVLLLIYVLLFAGATVLFYLMPKKFRTFTECFDPVLLLVSVIVFSCALVFRSDDFHLAVFVGLFALIFVVYASSRIHPETLNNQRSETFVIVPVAAMTVIVLGFVITTSVVIYKSFRTATFDMGIFNQMFHSMRKNLSAVTTCERGYALSHFRVHGSYILYLLLPVYAIFPSGETLIISQAVLVLSGVIPLYLIAKKRGFKGTALFFCCMIYVFSLGILSPCYFHFHENAFLPPLLMWLFYAAESKRHILFYIMSALVCMVKEDATLFVICICLYLAFEVKGKEKRKYLITGGIVVVYFLLMSFYLQKAGEGDMMMSSRMNTLMTEENQGVLAVLGNILSNPGHVLDVFVHREEPFVMLLQMMLPLLFMPFFTKKTHRMILLVPFVFFNLLFGAAYHYAAEIGYHYAFGTSALLIYMALINISEMEKDKKSIVVLASGAVVIITAFAMITGNLSNYENYVKYEEKYERIEECLERIPSDASVSCDTNFLPHVAGRDEIYSIDSSNFTFYGSSVAGLKNINQTDYVVLNMTDDGQIQACEIFKSKGYSVFLEEKDQVTILVLDEKH
ncbi:MAG: DUF2079 domain-containing protein [Clostridiales bacterium]|nr:DUF2079 domain-containing protein [Clostridiales bacterium]